MRKSAFWLTSTVATLVIAIVVVFLALDNRRDSVESAQFAASPDASAAQSPASPGSVPVQAAGSQSAKDREFQLTMILSGDPAWSIRGFHPTKLYEKYLDTAQAGDLDAAFILVKVLDACRHSVASEERLQALEYEGRLTSEQLRTVRERFRTCNEIRAVVPDLHAERDRWYGIVKEGRHPLFLVQERGKPFEERRALVLIAVTQVYPEDFMFEDAYVAAAKLYVDYPAHGVDETQFFAWQVLAVQRSFGDREFQYMLDQMRATFPAGQYQEIIARKEKLADAIRRRDWNALGL